MTLLELEFTMSHPLVGTKLYGFCDKYFGRDSWGDKRIEAIGVDWIVTRSCDSEIPDFAVFESQEEMIERVRDWSQKPKEDDF